MTGELFSLLGEHSILAGSVFPSGGFDEKENNTAFEQGVKNGSVQTLSHALFTVRTNHLLKRFSTEANYHYLSGVLIGTELGELLKVNMDTITLVGEDNLVANYLRAVKILGIKTNLKTTDAAAATTQGQLAIYRRLYR